MPEEIPQDDILDTAEILLRDSSEIPANTILEVPAESLLAEKQAFDSSRAGAEKFAQIVDLLLDKAQASQSEFERMTVDVVLLSNTEVFLTFSSESIARKLGIQNPEALQKIQTLLREQALKPFGQDLLRALHNADIVTDESGTLPEESPKNEKRAVIAHAAYAAGQIWRGIDMADLPVSFSQSQRPYSKQMLLVRVLEVQRSAGSAQEKRQQLLRFLPLSKRDEAHSFLQQNEHLLEPFSHSETDRVMNLAGYYATKATVRFASEIWPEMDQQAILNRLDDIFQQDESVLTKKLQEPQFFDPDEIRVIVFGLQAANLTWIVSKPYQVLLEEKYNQSVSDGEKRKKGKDRLEDKNYNPFDIMVQEKGWEHAMLDKDQIEAGLIILQTEERQIDRK